MPDRPHDLRIVSLLHRSGWSVGDMATRGGDGRPGWLVPGFNGENLIRAEGATSVAAWGGAVDRARSLGMLRQTGSGKAESDLPTTVPLPGTATGAARKLAGAGPGSLDRSTQ